MKVAVWNPWIPKTIYNNPGGDWNPGWYVWKSLVHVFFLGSIFFCTFWVQGKLPDTPDFFDVPKGVKLLGSSDSLGVFRDV